MLSLEELRVMPKVELHRHLEGGVRPATAWELTRRYGLPVAGVETYEQFVGRACVRSPLGGLQEVLDALQLTRRTLCRREAIERVAFENVEDAARDGTRLLELRFAPSILAGLSGLGVEEVILAVLDGACRGMGRYPVEVGLLVCLRRKSPIEASEEAVAALLRLAEGSHPHAFRLVGIDLADDERAAAPELFAPLAERVRAAGLGVTIHTGLNTDAEAVRRTLRVLRPARIGHGIRVASDPPLMEQIRGEGLLLEISPTSNWITACVPSLEQHPLPHLLGAGLAVCLNSDDPQLFGIDLVHEHELAQRVYGLGPAELRRMNRAAAAASFLPAEVRRLVASALPE